MGDPCFADSRGIKFPYITSMLGNNLVFPVTALNKYSFFADCNNLANYVSNGPTVRILCRAQRWRAWSAERWKANPVGLCLKCG